MILKFKLVIICLWISFIPSYALAQTFDTAFTVRSTNQINKDKRSNTTLQNFYDATGQQRWISKDHIIIKTNKLRLSTVEEEISELEAKECKALLGRDTSALKNIWLRDFTLERPQNEVYTSGNPIPYYTGIHRTIENFTVFNDAVYTSGIEHIYRVRNDGKIAEPLKQRYTHVWIRKSFSWRLSSKTHSSIE